MRSTKILGRLDTLFKARKIPCGYARSSLLMYRMRRRLYVSYVSLDHVGKLYLNRRFQSLLNNKDKNHYPKTLNPFSASSIFDSATESGSCSGSPYVPPTFSKPFPRREANSSSICSSCQLPWIGMGTIKFCSFSWTSYLEKMSYR